MEIKNCGKKAIDMFCPNPFKCDSCECPDAMTCSEME